MPVFDSSDQATRIFTDLFVILLKDETFTQRMQDSHMSLHLIQTKPAMELHVTPEGAYHGAPQQPATLRIKMSCDTAHDLWLGKLLMPVAVAAGKVRIKGSVSKVLEFVPLLRPAFDQYPELARAEGLSA